MTVPFDDLHAEYIRASGRSCVDCAVLGRRWRAAYGTMLADSDFYVVGVRPDATQWWGPWPNMWVGLWRALESGRVYACDASQGSIHVWDDVMSQEADVHPLGFTPEGIWGLDDGHVYAWGIRLVAPGDQQPHLARYDGSAWRDMPSPGFYITKMHGLAPDLIYAAGRGGGMARWDGLAWTSFPMPEGGVFTDVFVAAPDELYATTRNGALLEGGATGWSVVTRTIDDRLPYACVTKFAGELFVGGSLQGLFRRVGKTPRLELIKHDVPAHQFEARAGSLIITTPTAIFGTDDGATFKSVMVNKLRDRTSTIDIAER